MKTSTFSGKVAAVTGAASGIGRSLAVALARRGCAVALSDVDEQRLAETAAACGGVKVTQRRLDVSDAAAVRAWADEVARDHGRVNLIFNNAGISYGATFAGGEADEFRRVIDVDFWGVVNGTRAFLPHLEASQDGHVVNISSIFGIIGFPGQSAYNAAKFAVRGFTESLRMELELTKSNVTATCIHPGGVKTNIARASKMHESLVALGTNMATAAEDTEKLFTLPPDDAADIILGGVARNARRVVVGSDARALDLMQRFFPTYYQRLVSFSVRRRIKA
jgi:NAD(P)-dependent dehydrogenase (short-subunit alcohol dehydrogenase family)